MRSSDADRRQSRGLLVPLVPGADQADLLVVGGYGHSRTREMILGGVTRDLLHHMTVPVLMSH